LLIWNTVSGRQNLPRDGDRILHQETDDGGFTIVRVGIVRTEGNALMICPAYRNISKRFSNKRIVADGLVWALSERKENETK
jgi:hypothetical protein